DKDFDFKQSFNVITFKATSGYEKRSLRSRRKRREYVLSYTNVNGLVKQAIDNFYISMSGDFQTFTFDLAHLSEVGTVTVRFDGAISKNHIITGGGGTIKDNIYNISFKLIETY
ncbi:hypothetical protein KAU11_11555, partial [Candidatus Babeliales bacterium]|nr:hypothetical protein [Candidatus Babeliales bacterium]